MPQLGRAIAEIGLEEIERNPCAPRRRVPQPIPPHPRVLGLTTVGPDTPYSHVWPLFVLFGAASGLVIAPSTAAALVSVAPDRAGMASGAVNTARQVGSVMGTALLGSLFTGRVSADLPHQLAAHGVPAVARAPIEAAVASGSTTPRLAGGGRAAIEDAFTSGVHAAWPSSPRCSSPPPWWP